MHGIRSGCERGVDDGVDREVALAARSGADADGAVREPHVQGGAVGVGVDRDGLDTEIARGADHAAGDLAAVRDQERVEHERSIVARPVDGGQGDLGLSSRALQYPVFSFVYTGRWRTRQAAIA